MHHVWPMQNNTTYISFGLFALAFIISSIGLSHLIDQVHLLSPWLPSGIALAGAFLWGRRFLIVVLISVFFIAISSMSFHGIELHPETKTLGAAVIAIGLTSQIGISTYLLNRYLGNPLLTDNDTATLIFILAIGLGISFVFAHICLAGLYHTGSLTTPHIYNSSIWNWWISDALGIILATPSMLSLAPQNEKIKHRGWIIGVCIVLIICVGLTTALSQQNHKHSAEQLIKREAQVIENGLYRVLNNNITIVQLLTTYLQSNPQFSRNDFQEIVKPLLADDKSISALSWNPIITVADRANFDNTLQSIYKKYYRSKGDPLPGDQHMVVVKYISPEEQHKNAIGFNVYSNPARKSVIDLSKRYLKPQATPIIQLVQSNIPEPAYLMFSPVYQVSNKVTSRDTPALLGYATGVFLAAKVIAQALDTDQLNMFHYRLLSDNNPEPFWGDEGIDSSAFTSSEISAQAKIDFAGRQWVLQLQPKPSFIVNYQARQSKALHIILLIVCSMVILQALLMRNRHLNFDRQVKIKTKELQAEKNKADQANASKSLFFANMSHELRTPLNAVTGFAQLAKDQEDISELRSYFDKVEIASKSLVTIINDILDLSKLDNQHLVLERISIDLHEILEKVELLFDISAQQKNLVWQVIDELPSERFYLGDPLRIEQILINLCGNAFKFTQQGQVTLTAKSQCYSDYSDISITIKDSGPGISEQQQNNLFQPFTQADSSTSRHFGGTGLGLTISKQLSQLMGGDIGIYSRLGEGAEFTFRLSLKHCPQGPKAIGNYQYQPVQGLKVLVAEDNTTNQMVIGGMLKRLQLDYQIVGDGQLAIEALEATEYDLVLMDIQMPVMDGYSAVTHLREDSRWQNLPIIALTANVMRTDIDQAYACGFTDYLAKPISLKRLEECLHRFNGIKRAAND